MVRITAVIVSMPPLLADIIRQVLTARAPIEVVAEIGSRSELAQRLRVLNPDLVLIGLERGETDRLCRSLLGDLPSATVIAVSNDARSAYVHEMRPTRVVKNDVSPASLADFLRGIVDRRSMSIHGSIPSPPKDG